MSQEICMTCVQTESIKLISMCLDLGLDLRTREDVRNFILVSCYTPDYKNQMFVEAVINAFMNLI
ncbi:MAG: hypothetical protein RTU63_08625 [Candidatus Thorarchaeota archaeon]